MSKDTVGKHVVAHVRAVGTEGTGDESAWVQCQRRGVSVDVEDCRRCGHCMEIRRDRTGRAATVICRVPSPRPGNERHIELPRLTAADLMTRNVLCVRLDLSLDAVTELFVESGLKAVPVVDEGGALVGIVSEADVLIDIYAQGRVHGEALDTAEGDESATAEARTRTVADVMAPVALTLPETAPVTQAAALMAFEGIYHVTILASDGRVVGVLSAADILYRLAKADGYVLPPPAR